MNDVVRHRRDNIRHALDGLGDAADGLHHVQGLAGTLTLVARLEEQQQGPESQQFEFQDWTQ